MAIKSPKRKKERRHHPPAFIFIGAAGLLIGITAKVAISFFNSRREKRALIGSDVRADISAREILKLSNRIVSQSKRVYDSVAAVPLDKATYANVIAPLDELEARMFPLIQTCVFPKLVSIYEDVRKASAEAERRIDAHVLESSSREDVYRAVKTVAAKGERMSPEAKSYVNCLIREFEQNGLNLPQAKRQQMLSLRSKIDELSQRYVKNLNEDNTFLAFSEGELTGMPPEFLKVLDKTENGKFKIRMRSHHVEVVLGYCKVGPTRKCVAIAYGKRCSEGNLVVLESLVELRHKYARLFGYSNYADFAVAQRMPKQSSKVFDFLEDISANLNDVAAQELRVLTELKKKEEGSAPFGIEDVLYYVKMSEKQQFDIDFVALQKYFPSDLVLSGLFKIIQDLFGLRFEQISDSPLWHTDVLIYSVFDLGSSELIGYFYLDLYTREGKYGHACVIPLQNGASRRDGKRQIPVALLICQMKKGTDENPNLLRFSEVVSLFHEFGHLVQHICNNAPFSRFSGLRVNPDFVEIPALLLENWCYEPASLKLISGFHQDITKPIGDDVCESLKKWRRSFAPLKMKQEILYSLFDQIVHSADNVDTVELFKHLHPKIMLGLPMLEGTNPASCFPRSAIAYESSCYTRLWSEVFSDDVFVSKFRGNLFNQQIGMEFRQKVLSPGAAADPSQLLSDFIGREPSIASFISRKGDPFL